jgi:sugar lactone lactonase YvrE
MFRSVLRLLLLTSSTIPLFAQGTLTTLVGKQWVFPDGVRAEDAPLSTGSVAADDRGNIFVGDCENRLVHRIDSQGVLRIYAGLGQGEQTRAFEVARRASFSYPCSISIDSNRNVFVADGSVIRAIDLGGFIRTVAGNGSCGYSPDGTLATEARLINPSQPAFDSRGRAHFVEGTVGGDCLGTGRRVRMIDENGRLQTVAATGVAGYSGDGGLARLAEFRFSGDGSGLAFDSADNLYISDTGNHVIRRVRKSDGIVERFAGIVGEAPVDLPGGDGGSALQARLEAPFGLSFDSTGALFVADMTRVRRISGGILTTVAGSGQRGFSGDNGPATAARIEVVRSVAVPSTSDLLISSGVRVRRVRSGTITTIAGSGRFRFEGDNGPATDGVLNTPGCLFFDAARTATLFCDTGNQRIRRVDAAGLLTTVAGNNTDGDPVDNALAVESNFKSPNAVVADAAGNLYITTNNTVALYKVDVNGRVTRLLSNADIGTPSAMTIDTAGNLYIAASDRDPHPMTDKIYRLTPLGELTVFAGTGERGFAGDGGAATLALLNQPTALVIDTQGRLFIGETGSKRIRMVQNGIVSTYAGTGIDGVEGDNGSALLANFRTFGGLALDAGGNLLISDPDAMTIRRINAFTRVITKVSGVNPFAYEGDGKPAAQGSFRYPRGIAFNERGELMIADSGNHVIRATLPVRPAFGAEPRLLIFDTFNGAASPAAQDLNVSGGPTARQVTAVANSAGWLSIDPASRNTPNRFTVRANSTGLAVGTYSGFIALTSTGAVPESRQIPVTLVVLPRTDVTVTANTVTSTPAADKDPVREATAGSLVRGNRTTLLFRVGNGGPDVAENVRIVPALAPELTLLEASFTGTGCSGLVCPQIAVGQTAEYRAVVAVKPSLSTGSVVTAAVAVSSETRDRNAANDAAEFALTVTGTASSARYTLTTGILSGLGSIQPSPQPAAGGTYLAGEPILLTAVPAPGCTFTAWAGDLAGAANPIPLLMTSNKSALARFNCPLTGGLQFVPLPPCRVMDTRAAEGKTGAYGPPAMVGGSVRVVPISGQACGVPADARAFSLNVTVVPQGGLQYLTLWPSGRAQPLASTLNAFEGQVVANAALVEAGIDGAVSVFVTNTTDVILDINGYFR